MSGALGVCAGSSLPAMALIAVTQRATSSLGWERAGSPGESELLSESPNSPSQVQLGGSVTTGQGFGLQDLKNVHWGTQARHWPRQVRIPALFFEWSTSSSLSLGLE